MKVATVKAHPRDVLLHPRHPRVPALDRVLQVLHPLAEAVYFFCAPPWCPG